jgi:hypothetical protein
LYKFARLWWLPDFGAAARWIRVASYAPYFLLFAAFLVRGVWRRECWSPSWLVLHASTVALIATALVFCGEPRFRDATMPVLMIYAAIGFMPAWRLQSAETHCRDPENAVR